MAYFANGTIGEIWEESNCDKGRGCIHIAGDRECPLLEAHADLNYDQHERELSRLPSWLRWLRRQAERIISRIKGNPFWMFRRRPRPLTGRAKGIKEVLDILIPTNEAGYPTPCRMYQEIKIVSDKTTFEAQYITVGD